MDEAYLASIVLWACPRIPMGWMACEGQVLQVAQYTALFSLIGAAYGGNGSTTFALPDLRGAVPVGFDASKPDYNQLGATGGASSRTISTAPQVPMSLTIRPENMPSHTHSATFAGTTGTSVDIAIPAVGNTGPDTNVPGTTALLSKIQNTAKPPAAMPGYNTSVAADTTLKPFSVPLPAPQGSVTTGAAGGGQPLATTLTVPIQATVDVRQPYQVLRYIICVNGLYPSFD